MKKKTVKDLLSWVGAFVVFVFIWGCFSFYFPMSDTYDCTSVFAGGCAVLAIYFIVQFMNDFFEFLDQFEFVRKSAEPKPVEESPTPEVDV